MRLRRRRHAVRSKIAKILLAAVYITVLAMAGLGFNGTYSIFSTLARTPPGEARAAGTEDLLVVSGKFDLEEWLQTGKSGLTVTNVSPGNLWLYFTVEGDLGRAIRHINPVKLNAGQDYQVPLEPAAVGELGLLGWKNNGDVFEGKIIARVLNNFSAWEVGTVTIPGEELYEKMVAEQDDPAGELPGVKSVADVIRLIAEKADLAEERDRLLKERDELLEVNSALEQRNAELENRIEVLENEVECLGASLSASRETISVLEQQPPAPEQQPQPGNSATPPEQGEQPDTGQQTGEYLPDQETPEGPAGEPGAGPGENSEEPAGEPGEQPGTEAPQEPVSDPAAGTGPETPQERDNGGAEEPGKDAGETGPENMDSDNGGEGSTSGGTNEGSMPDSVGSGGEQESPGNDAGGTGDGAGQNTPQHGQSVTMPDVIQPTARQPRGMPEEEEKPDM